MGTTGETSGAVQVGEGLDGLQRFWPLDDGVLGYGVAAYMSAKLITCRLYNLQSNQLLAMLKAPGEYAVQSGKELIASLTAVLDQLSEQAGIPLSKLTVAVVSGTTAMESKAAGLNPAELRMTSRRGSASSAATSNTCLPAPIPSPWARRSSFPVSTHRLAATFSVACWP